MKLKFLPTAQRFPIQMAYFIILTAYVAIPWWTKDELVSKLRHSKKQLQLITAESESSISSRNILNLFLVIWKNEYPRMGFLKPKLLDKGATYPTVLHNESLVGCKITAKANVALKSKKPNKIIVTKSARSKCAYFQQSQVSSFNSNTQTSNNSNRNRILLMISISLHPKF